MGREQAKNYWKTKPAQLYSMFLNAEAQELDALERPEIVSLLPPLKHKVILDLGAGIGRFTQEFACCAKKVVSLDVCPQFIEESKKRAKECTNIEWLLSDVMDAAFEEKSFDLIFISWVFMYLEDSEVQSLIQKLHLWLQPDGHLFFRESCAATTHTLDPTGNVKKPVPASIPLYWATYRSPIAYDRLFHNWKLVQSGNIRAFETLKADPFKYYWLYQPNKNR
ncbi:MAG: hypothetical protein A3D96_02100 [Chlamydiae bacterium RIFCSPHIGHO2_12_FULL_44_59]|nr:MAG: hypothetical protein A2796_04790 [Chlamydiae bacterium RIFCSPHIGHO2_01_FULL_44_39]OGN57954.1 MAG: hypothetical protein A3C42_04800 [Chlamydiae bacterium RIFCSPHIGHO2_02_FULL_45_9]OGN60700.1 MAG: hypothetical protein A3D96_02100 [Chlamydiae bacterium RIFCSPHIGHO2_12_FULL_44_59]OGN66960.1 MAG: hypothetical protein A2978_02330 [Chlamydiae bacterium RIFCSPLOWO2_01_FULL_44_52]OGN67511.1 MAG: hypothetical protein A3I67_03545 [Chlamydiae bacterium RIFCSPLOWO2_02_FULL_45_22]OGN71213.1 MAG: hyp